MKNNNKKNQPNFWEHAFLALESVGRKDEMQIQPIT